MKEKIIKREKTFTLCVETVTQLDEEQLKKVEGGQAYEANNAEQESCIGYYCE